MLVEYNNNCYEIILLYIALQILRYRELYRYRELFIAHEI